MNYSLARTTIWAVALVVSVWLLVEVRNTPNGVEMLRHDSTSTSRSVAVEALTDGSVHHVEAVKQEPLAQKQKPLAHKSGAHRCPEVDPNAADLRNFFKAQSEEDKLLLKWFNGLCGGTYIEMGGADGVTYSNSHYFNKKAGWKGLLVELLPHFYAKMVKNRPNELALVNAAVCAEPRTLHYVGGTFTSGVWEFSSPSFREQWWKGVTFDKTKEVQCLPLQTIIKDHIGDTAYFDFFSLDVEGAEFEALQSVDFDKVGFGILFVESDRHNELKNMALRTFLVRNGYTFLMNENRSWWFINNDFDNIYRDILYPNTPN